MSKALSITLVWLVAEIWTLHPHYYLALRRMRAAHYGYPSQVLVKHKDLFRLQLPALAIVVSVVIARMLLGRDVLAGVGFGGVLFASAFTALLYWFYPEVNLAPAETGTWLDRLQAPDAVWVTSGVVYAIIATLGCLFIVTMLLFGVP